MFLYKRIIKRNDEIVLIDSIIVKDYQRDIKSSLILFLQNSDYCWISNGESTEYIENVINTEFELIDDNYISVYESDTNEMTEIYYCKI